MSDPAEFRKLQEALEADPAVTTAWLFGSAARGRMRPDSDLDVAVVWRDADARRRASDELIDRVAALSAVCRRHVDLVDFEGADLTLRTQVLEHGRLLVDGDPERRKRLHAETLIAWWDGEPLRRRTQELFFRRVREMAGHG